MNQPIRFTNRKEAGKLLAEKLSEYKGHDVVVYALPRGGVVTAYEIAKELSAPLDLIIARKIGHPHHLEYAIAAVAQNGHIVKEEKEVKKIEKKWFEEELIKARKEAARRREEYLKGRDEVSPEGKIAILVDDGIATGLTIRVGILELKHKNPSKIVVAAPIIPRQIFDLLQKEVDEVVALEVPKESEFLGAVGSYYDFFPQVSDEEVIGYLNSLPLSSIMAS